jgi:hypothetical protein
MLSQTDLKILRRAIPRGGIKEIHEMVRKRKIDLSYESVSAIIRGIMFRQDVIDVVIEYVEKHKIEEAKKAQALSKKIHSLAS